MKLKGPRRGFSRRYKKSKIFEKQLMCLGTNANGLNTKRDSFYHIVNYLKPSVVTVQETKFSCYRTLKIPGYEIFEILRVDKSGGGLLTAIHTDLNPVLISSDEDS